MDTARLSKILKALSHEKRLELYIEIAKQSESNFETEDCGCFVCDVMEKLNIGAPTVSHHLKELSNAGLIETERRGKFVVARVNKETLEEARSLLDI
jgi:DNA-binding transcriptional ArsR family regulator